MKSNLGQELPFINDCKSNLLNCRFKYEPKFMPILVFIGLIISIFLIMPNFVVCFNYIFFQKIFFGKTLWQVLHPLQKGSKKVRIEKSRSSSLVFSGTKTNHSENLTNKLAIYMKLNDANSVNSFEKNKGNKILPVMVTDMEAEDKGED